MSATDPHYDDPDLPDDLDKWTYALDHDGDIRWNSDANNVYTVDGTTAVKQDLLVALATHEGDDPLDERFGLDVFEAVRSNTKLRHELTRTLNYDDYRHDRVQAVTNIAIYEGSEGSRENVRIHIDVDLETNEPLTLIFDLFAGTLTVVGG